MTPEIGYVISIKNGIVITNIGNYKLDYFTFDPVEGDRFTVMREGKEIVIDLV
jgi:hypothetical protein